MACYRPLTSAELESEPRSLTGPLLPELEHTEENQRISAILAGVRGEWRLYLDEMRRAPLQCAVDAHRFYEFENLGRWECWQHACSLEQPDKTHPREFYPCCGAQGAEAEGCVRADHRLHYAPYEALPVLEMPQSVFDRVQKVFGPPQRVKRAFNRVSIDRYDKAETFRRRARADRQAKLEAEGRA